jgi:hypothetical protein
MKKRPTRGADLWPEQISGLSKRPLHELKFRVNPVLRHSAGSHLQSVVYD